MRIIFSVLLACSVSVSVSAKEVQKKEADKIESANEKSKKSKSKQRKDVSQKKSDKKQSELKILKIVSKPKFVRTKSIPLRIHNKDKKKTPTENVWLVFREGKDEIRVLWYNDPGLKEPVKLASDQKFTFWLKRTIRFEKDMWDLIKITQGKKVILEYDEKPFRDVLKK